MSSASTTDPPERLRPRHRADPEQLERLRQPVRGDERGHPVGPFGLGQRREELRPLGDRRGPGRAGRGRGRRTEQGPRPLRVALAHRGPAPGGVQLARPVVGDRQRHDLLPPGARRTAPARRPSGVASTNCPSHQDRSPRPVGGTATTPSRCIPASHSCGASTAMDAPRPRTVGVDARRRTGRHPPGERRGGQGGEQLGRRGAHVAAAVGERLLQELLVRRRRARSAGSPGTSAGPRPARWTRCVVSRASAAAGIPRPYGIEQRDPLREQPLLPQPVHRLRIAGVGDAASRPLHRAGRTSTRGSARPATGRAARRRRAPAGAGRCGPARRPAAAAPGRPGPGTRAGWRWPATAG